MPSNTAHHKFLTTELPQRLTHLKSDAAAKFGLMTPQHMVEHLILMTKISVKRYADCPDTPTEGQLKFKKFLENGAKFEYRPSKKTKADLPKLKYGSLQEAVENYPIGIKRFYDHYDANPDFISFNAFQGELGFEDLEFIHSQHFEYHLGQFGL